MTGTNNFRLSLLENAVFHQELADFFEDDDFSTCERRCAVDSFNDIDQAARRQREITPWTRGVLDC